MYPFWCPSCFQFYPEQGFCPFDGTALEATPPEFAARLAPAALPAAAPRAPVRAVSAQDDPSAALAAYRRPPSGHPAGGYDRLVGETLDGRYHIERKIGEGGMGVVFAARHTVIERPLAIKVLKREIARDAATVKRFVQEAKAASRIGHPNIVDVTDFGTTPDGMTYSVMEYVEGLTLSQVIKLSAPLPLARAVPIAAQIARALAAAHVKGIIHRDLKPENVFLVQREGRRDFVKIVDFGIAKVTPIEGHTGEGPRLTRAGSVFGTPEYMAPEQAAGREIDRRADVYSLGIILYEMIAGKVPHKGESMVRTLAMQMLDPIVPPSQLCDGLELAPEVEAVVMKALAKDPDERYASMEELLAALEQVAGTLAMAPAPPGTSPVASDRLELMSLPPGADANMLGSQTWDASDQGAPTQKSARTFEASPPPLPRRPSPAVPVVPVVRPTPVPRGPASRTVPGDPAFLSAGRLDPADPAFEAPPARARRWLLLIAIVVLFGGGGLATALVWTHRSGPSAGIVPPDAAVSLDAAVAAEAPVDAGVAIAETPVDAAPLDAAAVAPLVDAGRAPSTRRRDAGVAATGALDIGPARRVAIQVITKPDSGTIYVGTAYRGPSGTTIEEPFGTRLTVRCKLGQKEGSVDVVFDGEQEVVLCLIKQDRRCVPGMKNPFEDCPEDEP